MEKIYKMSFYKLYDALLAKLEKKQRTKEEFDQTITWLTGYSASEIENHYANKELSYEMFFDAAPRMNPNRVYVVGKICGVDIASIEVELTKNMRILDKLVDDLAKGKSLETILINEDASPISDYIAKQADDQQDLLFRVYEILKAALPGAIEKISYGMPSFWDQKTIIHFAANKKHLGIYPGPQAIEEFKHRLTDYKTSKGAIQIPYDQALPQQLIHDLAVWARGYVK